jgi:anaerobic selenocysteine-containing dehydrogenase
LLKKGYVACLDHILRGSGLTVAGLDKADRPIKAPTAAPYIPGAYTKEGYDTPTGKFEFASQLIAKYEKSHGLKPLPVYTSPFSDETDEAAAVRLFPFILTTGTRLPNAIHSRFHDIPWARSLRPDAMADINEADAERKGIEEGDRIRITTKYNSITVKAHVTGKVRRGNIHLFHGYREANANLLVSPDRLDPYSGFPAYKSNLCDYQKAEEVGI